ncbi:hypothetical protein GF382_03650 [Candidatus Falkowbacteria bacterium]|nr:hypothetical protein [Candidatus Falkowbacteria bacterium]
MKKKIDFILMLSILACSLAPFSVFARTEVGQQSVDYDYIYFNRGRDPYFITEDITLKPGQTIKVDSNTEFIFADGADLCFENRGCLKGDYLYKQGLGGNRVFVGFNTYIILEENGETISYLADYDQNDERDINFSLKSLFDSVLAIRVEDVNDSTDFHKFVFNLNDIDTKPYLRFNGAAPYFEDREEQEIGDDSTPVWKQASNWLRGEAIDGKIFLQVQENGEAWYVYPENSRRYYLGRPADAFRIMRELALGVDHSFITSYTTFPKRMAGMILLDVEDNGKAYYIDPNHRQAHYLGRPDDAFKVMREQGIGITNQDLMNIAFGK